MIDIKMPNARQLEIIHEMARKKREVIPSLSYDESLIQLAWQVAWESCHFQMTSSYKKR